ncbi:MAG: UDP-2,3-diacylglucosamine diphosphatase [Aestuariibacter sp.]
MNKTLFIADLHLSAEREDITTCFLQFLQDLDHNTDALYILGDLFEVWVGDDDINPFTENVITALATLSDKNIPVYFIHGNRDFLIRKKFAKKASLTLLPERMVIDLYGVPTLIMHGDELCTRDVAYQKFRKKARSWWWPNLVLQLPLAVRKKIAERGRRVSKMNQQALTESIMDVTPEEVIKVMQNHSVQRLIHGHTHRPAIHDVQLQDKAGKRIVLGDWYEQGSILEVNENDYQLKQLPFSLNLK